MTTASFHPFHPAAAALPGRAVKITRRTRTAPMVRRPAALWQQSVRVNEGRPLVERLACLLLILLAAAAIAYGALVTVRTFQGDGLQRAVAKIVNHDTR